MKPNQSARTKQIAKPFRLINHYELQQLQQRINQRLQVWNEQYALYPLSVTVNKADPPRLDTVNGWQFGEQQTCYAWALENDVSVLNDCLFGDISACFSAVSETLLLTLLQDLLDNPALHQQRLTTLGNDWFYLGSPVLALTFTSRCYSLTCYLSPDWVVAALGSPKSRPDLTTTLADALANTTLECQVTFPAIPLRLHQLLDLQIGDVLKTDHLLTQPLQLTCQHHVLSAVDIGVHDDFKSIQLVSFVCPLP